MEEETINKEQEGSGWVSDMYQGFVDYTDKYLNWFGSDRSEVPETANDTLTSSQKNEKQYQDYNKQLEVKRAFYGVAQASEEEIYPGPSRRKDFQEVSKDVAQEFNTVNDFYESAKGTKKNFPVYIDENSGITVGNGIDLLHNTPSVLREAGVSSKVVDALIAEGAFGVAGSKELYNKVKDIKFSDDDLKALSIYTIQKNSKWMQKTWEENRGLSVQATAMLAQIRHKAGPTALNTNNSYAAGETDLSRADESFMKQYVGGKNTHKTNLIKELLDSGEATDKSIYYALDAIRKSYVTNKGKVDTKALRYRTYSKYMYTLKHKGALKTGTNWDYEKGLGDYDTN